MDTRTPYLQMSPKKLTWLIYQEDRKDRNKYSWNVETERILRSLGLKDYWESQIIPESADKWKSIVKKELIKRRTKIWNRSRKDKVSLQLSNKLKPEWGKAKCLEMEDKVGRQLLTQYRTGKCKLQESLGRVTRKDRTCKLRWKEVESVG